MNKYLFFLKKVITRSFFDNTTLRHESALIKIDLVKPIFVS